MKKKIVIFVGMLTMAITAGIMFITGQKINAESPSLLKQNIEALAQWEPDNPVWFPKSKMTMIMTQQSVTTGFEFRFQFGPGPDDWQTSLGYDRHETYVPVYCCIITGEPEECDLSGEYEICDFLPIR